MSIKDTTQKVNKNSYLTKLIIITSLLLSSVVVSFVVLDLKINELKEESKELKKFKDSLEDGIYVLKEDMPTKLSDLENDEKYLKENDVNNAILKQKEEIFSEITKRGYISINAFNDYKKQVQNQIDSLPISSSTNKTVINNTNVDYEDFKEFIRDTYYPVGTLYYSMDVSFNPEDAWGGTWVKISEGNFVEATEDETKVGEHEDAGIPNATFIFESWRPDGTAYDHIVSNETTSGFTAGNMWNGDQKGKQVFSLNKASSVYKDDVSTVQPNAFYAYIWKRIS